MSLVSGRQVRVTVTVTGTWTWGHVESATADGLSYGAEIGAFFTDTSVCIGCKACEVACKEWNLVPEDGFVWTGALARQHGRAEREHVAPRCVRRAQRATGRRHRSVADELGRLQALHARRLSRRLSHGRDLPHRVRHRRHPGRRLQRLRLLHPRLSLRRDQSARARPGSRARRRGTRRRRPQVHTLLRPLAGRPRARVREGLPDRLDPVRPARRARRKGARALRAAGRGGRRRRAPLRRRPERRRGRLRRVLPAPRRPRGLRPAARPGRHDPRPGGDLGRGGGGRGPPRRRPARRIRVGSR